MGITLDLKVETPLDDDDRDILAGLSVMILAIANRQNLADQRDPEREEAECGCVTIEGTLVESCEEHSPTPLDPKGMN